MRKLALAISLIALGAPAASAADIEARPYAAAPMVAAGWNWSGFYAGANGGYGSSRNCWDLVNGVGAVIGTEGCHTATGGLAGIQVGYRTQAYGFVFGLEAQGDWAKLNGAGTANTLFFAPPGVVNTTRIDAFGLFTGQVGFAWNEVLFYVKGGGALVTGRFQDFITGTNIVAVSAPETRFGGTVGAGIEVGFAPNWSFGVVYDHLFMRTSTVDFSSLGIVPGLPLPTDRIRQDVDLVTVRINYAFGAPSLSKY
jgi:outer membrane immunogenic protein